MPPLNGPTTRRHSESLAPGDRELRARVGVVIVGRNEGLRLKRCLAAVSKASLPVDHLVYVDSGSIDGSVEWAESHGCDVVALDASIPFTAGRARNEGFARLTTQYPHIEFVQFVDADCELAPLWLAQAAEKLDLNPGLAGVSGRLAERHRNSSIYNLLCDIEWDAPAGATRFFGGIFMIRVAAFQQVSGFRSAVIAAEDSELCVRLRAARWHLERLDVPLGWHDADMQHFSQWWQRSVRTGHAYAEGVAMHGRGPERHFVRESLRAWAWGLVWPCAVIGLAPVTHGGSFLLLAAPLAVCLKNCCGRHAPPLPFRERAIWAVFLMLAKLPQGIGQLKYLWRRVARRPLRLIEHKRPRPRAQNEVQT